MSHVQSSIGLLYPINHYCCCCFCRWILMMGPSQHVNKNIARIFTWLKTHLFNDWCHVTRNAATTPTTAHWVQPLQKQFSKQMSIFMHLVSILYCLILCVCVCVCVFRILTLSLLRYPEPAYDRQYALDHPQVRTIDHWRIPHLSALPPNLSAWRVTYGAMVWEPFDPKGLVVKLLILAFY